MSFRTLVLQSVLSKFEHWLSISQISHRKFVNHFLFRLLVMILTPGQFFMSVGNDLP